MSLTVCEIFVSLQGESTFAGLPCVFVRLTGCNLHCSWCDTEYARTEAHTMTRDQILREVRAFNCSLVEITGGEPLLQQETPMLAKDLLDQGFQVLVETNGSLSIAPLDPGSIRILDVKCPSSGEGDSFLETNYSVVTATDEFKFVVGDRTDYEFARKIIRTRLAHHPKTGIHISPVFGSITLDTLAAWILEDRLDARLSLQQHKLIWHPEKRGV